jgi:hypothetical protein
MRFVPVIAALSAIAGCATAPSATPMATKVASAESLSNSEQTCRLERPTGSLMLKTVCEVAVPESVRRNDLDQYKDTIRNGTTMPSIGAGAGR